MTSLRSMRVSSQNPNRTSLVLKKYGEDINRQVESSRSISQKYINKVANNITWLSSVKAASTTNMDLATELTNNSTMDGVTLASDDRVLLKNQTVATTNGVYTITASGAPTRVSDFATGDGVSSHSVFVENGTKNADQGYVIINDSGEGVNGDIVDTANLVFTQFTGLGQITAGDALLKDANILHVNVDDSSLEVSSDALQIKALGVTNDMLAGSVANSKLSNSSLTVAAGDGLQTGGSVSLGGSVTIDVDSTIIRTTGGQTINGNLDIANGLDITGAPLTTAAGITHTNGEVLVSGGNVQLHDNVAFSLGTNDDVSMSHDGTNSKITSAIGNFTVDNTAADKKTVMMLGADTSTVAFEVQNNSASALFGVDGAGDTTVTGSLTVDNIKVNGTTIGHTSDTDLLTLTSAQLIVAGNCDVTNGLDVTGAPLTTAAGITHTSGEVLVSGGNVQLHDNVAFSLGTNDDVSMSHDGTNSKITSATGNFTVDNTSVDKKTVMMLGADTSAVAFEVQNNSGSNLFNVNGAGLTTIAGDLIINGTTTTVNSTTIVVDDPLLELSNNNTTNAVDIGTYGKYVDGGTKYTGVVWDAGDAKLRAFHGLAEQPTTTINTSGSGYAVSTLVCNLEGEGDSSITGSLTVDDIKVNGTTIGHTSDTDLLTLTSAQLIVAGNCDVTNGLDVTGAPLTTAAGITHTSGEVLVSGGNVQLHDNVALSLGTNDDVSMSHDGTNSILTAATGNFTVDNTAVDKKTVMMLGADTSTVAFEVQNNSASTLFGVDGSGGCMIGSTSTAAKKLEIVDSSTAQLRLSKDGSDHIQFFAEGGADARLFIQSSHTDRVNLVLKTLDTEVMTIGASDDLNRVNIGCKESGSILNLQAEQSGVSRKFLSCNPAAQAELVVNEDTVDMDFRVESDGNTHALFVEGSTSKVGISNNNPSTTLDITGTLAVSGQVDFASNIDASAGIDIDTDNVALTIGAGGDISMSHDGTNSILTAATGNFTVDNTAVDKKTIMILGADTSAVAFEVQNNSASALFGVDGAGDTTVTGSLTVDNIKVNGTTIGHTSDTDLLTLTSAQLIVAGNCDVTNGLDVTGAPLTTAAGITHTSGEVLVSGGNVQLHDNVAFSLGTNDDVSMSHDGTNSILTAATGNFTVDNTAVDKKTVMMLGADTSAVAFEVQNNSASTLFGVDGSGGCMIGSTSTAAKKLEIVDPSTAQLRLSKDGTDHIQFFAEGGADARLFIQSSHTDRINLVLKTSDTEVFTINGDDNNNIINLSARETGAKLNLTGEQSGVSRKFLSCNPAAQAELVVNEDTIDMDFRVESDGNTHALFVEGSTSKVGISNNNPSTTLDVTGTLAVSGQVDFASNIDASAGIDIDTDNVALTIGAGGDISMSHDGTNSILTAATGNFTVDNTAVDKKTIMILGADTSAVAFEVQNNSASALFGVDGAGDTTVTGSLTVDNIKVNGTTIGHTSDTDLLTLTSAQLIVAGNCDVTNGLDVTGAPLTTAAGITHTSGEVLVSGGNVQLHDNVAFSLGTNDDVSMSHDGTNSILTAATGNFTVDNTAVDKKTIMILGADTSAVAFEVQNNSASTLFGVDGSGGCMIGSTSTAAKKLEIVDPSTAQLRLSKDGTDHIQFFAEGGADARLFIQSSHTDRINLVLKTLDTEVFTINGDDNNNVINLSARETGAKLNLTGEQSGVSRKFLSCNPAAQAELVVNEDTIDMDFRVESDGNTHALFVEGSTSKIGISNSNPSTTLDVTGSIGASAQIVGGDAIIQKSTITVESTAANVTWTIAHFLGQMILRDPNGGARIDISPAASLVVAGITSCAVGSSFRVVLRNSGAALVTMSAGAGAVLSGTMTIATGDSREFLCIVTDIGSGTEGYTMYSINYGTF